jgi:hypothetical protein
MKMSAFWGIAWRILLKTDKLTNVAQMPTASIIPNYK